MQLTKLLATTTGSRVKTSFSHRIEELFSTPHKTSSFVFTNLQKLFAFVTAKPCQWLLPPSAQKDADWSIHVTTSCKQITWEGHTMPTALKGYSKIETIIVLFTLSGKFM